MSQQQDEAFVKTFIMVLAALVVFTISVFVLAQVVGGSVETATFEPTVVAERTKPVGEIEVASEESSIAKAEPVEKSGEEIYNTACMACHNTGAAGAPKLGDNAAWAPRLAKGTETLYNSAINGLNAMPPKGGNASLSDEEVKKAVDYMLPSVEATEQPAPAATPEEKPAEATEETTPEPATEEATALEVQ